MADYSELIEPTNVLEQSDIQEDTQDQVSEEPVSEEQEPVDSDSDQKEEESGEPDKDTSKGDDDVDLRKAAREIREGLNKLRDIDPRAAKMMRTALGHELAYQETFKTPQEARVFKAAVDAIGGTEALTQMQEQVAFSQEIDSLSEAGDPKVIETFAKDFPDGFKKLFPHYLDSIKKMDGEAYAKAIQPHLIDSLEATGLGNVLFSLKEAADSGDSRTVQKIASDIIYWYNSQKSAAAQFRSDATNPDKDKVNEEWQKINSEKEKMFESQWKKPVQEHSSAAIWKAGEPYVRNVPIGQQHAFFQAVISEIDRRLTSDSIYTSQENALMKSKNRDINKIVSFKKAKIDTVILPSIEKIAKDFGYKQTPKQAVKPNGLDKAKPLAPVTGAGSSPTNPIYVDEARKPSVADRDIDKMGGRDKALSHQIAGRALMKSGPYRGRWVSWRPKPAGK
jgi:hypothetical protein